MKSVMKHKFGQVPSVGAPRSVFNCSHGYKTTFDAGLLVPIYTDEIYPGDTFRMNFNLLCRLLSPLEAPVMDNMFIETFWFFVPNRLVWDNFQKFMGEQVDPGDSIDYTVPTMTSPAVTGYTENSLSDYFGLPVGVAGIEHISLYHRAYNLIWNEWFRDENLQDSVVVDRDDGPDDPADYSIKKRCKRFDYFTGCLPWPQKGDSVLLPLGDTAPVTSDGVPMQFASTADGTGFTIYSTGGMDVYSNGGAGTNPYYVGDNGSGKSGWEADLSAATAASINNLRQAFQLQRMLERDARGGTRYTEIVRSHFQVVSPDQRLQRPEILHTSSARIVNQQVVQTSDVVYSSELGQLAGYSYATSHSGWNKSFTEHGVVIGLVNVRADLTYQQGLDRKWTREYREDYYFPALAHLGEQAVLNQEIYCDGSSNDTDVFGYQERWSELRHKQSRITGTLRSTAATPLDMWHLSQEFSSLPVLGDTFIKDNPPIERISKVATGVQFVLDSYFDLRCVRPLPTFSVPGLIDHF